jgi:hypothetical protein
VNNQQLKVRDAKLAIAAVRRSMSQQRGSDDAAASKALEPGSSGASPGGRYASSSSSGGGGGSGERLGGLAHDPSLWARAGSHWRAPPELAPRAGGAPRATYRLAAVAADLRAQVAALESQCAALEAEQRDAEAALRAQVAAPKRPTRHGRGAGQWAG